MIRAVDLALAGQIIASSGIVINREAIDRCTTCGTTFRRKNAYRHYASRGHARRFRRAWDLGSWQGRHPAPPATRR